MATSESQVTTVQNVDRFSDSDPVAGCCSHYIEFDWGMRVPRGGKLHPPSFNFRQIEIVLIKRYVWAIGLVLSWSHSLQGSRIDTNHLSAGEVPGQNLQTGPPQTFVV